MHSDDNKFRTRLWIAIHITAASVVLFLIILGCVVSFNGGNFKIALTLAFSLSVALGGLLLAILLATPSRQYTNHFFARHLTRENFGTPKSVLFYAIGMTGLVIVILAKAVSNYSGG